ncbi:MAG TPA: hypothetical protein DCE41_13155 [Cytophagales bacterium]|nr:hypothetical protein [Cytophagales bacterium]
MHDSQKNQKLLWGIVLSGVAVRVVLLWLLRPEFVGWFNHTYYYYVQTGGLLKQGVLPFPDMPLLFYLYALTAKGMAFLGADTSAAIVGSSRFWMCLFPSLIPIPVFAVLQSLDPWNTLRRRKWMLVAASGLLPLTVMHLPEMLQKNALGLLLLAVLMALTYKALQSFTWQKAVAIIVVVALILFTHLGTAVAALLYALAVWIALVLVHPRKAQLLWWGGKLVLAALLVALLVTFSMDVGRGERMLHYAFTSFRTSWLATLFTKPIGHPDWFPALVGTIFPAAILWWLLRAYHRKHELLETWDRVFWLSAIFFAYLLVFPLWDPAVTVRFILFLSLPLLWIVGYLLLRYLSKRWIKNLLAGSLASLCLLMLIGEAISSQLNRQRNRATYEELLALKEEIRFSADDDLILSQNGAEHIANWFLGTKASLITSLTQEDFQTYRNVYVLTPTETRVEEWQYTGKSTADEEDRYWLMRHPVLLPADAEELVSTPYLLLHQLPESPANWVFDQKGAWLSYEK